MVDQRRHIEYCAHARYQTNQTKPPQQIARMEGEGRQEGQHNKGVLGDHEGQYVRHRVFVKYRYCTPLAVVSFISDLYPRREKSEIMNHNMSKVARYVLFF